MNSAQDDVYGVFVCCCGMCHEHQGKRSEDWSCEGSEGTGIKHRGTWGEDYTFQWQATLKDLDIWLLYTGKVPM